MIKHILTISVLIAVISYYVQAQMFISKANAEAKIQRMVRGLHLALETKNETDFASYFSPSAVYYPPQASPLLGKSDILSGARSYLSSIGSLNVIFVNTTLFWVDYHTFHENGTILYSTKPVSSVSPSTTIPATMASSSVMPSSTVSATVRPISTVSLSSRPLSSRPVSTTSSSAVPSTTPSPTAVHLENFFAIYSLDRNSAGLGIPLITKVIVYVNNVSCPPSSSSTTSSPSAAKLFYC